MLSNINNSSTNYQPKAEDDEIDLGELIKTILDGKYLITFIALFFLALGIVKAVSDTPIYKADALLQIENKPGPLDALTSAVPSIVSGTPAVALTEIEIIKSRKVLGKAVSNLHLDIIAKPNYFPKIGAAIANRFQKKHKKGKVSAPLFGLDQYAWGGEAIGIDTFSVPESLMNKQLILIAGEQGHFTLLDDNQLILEGDVGKPISKQLDDSQETLTLFVSQLKGRPGTQFTVMKQSLGSGIDQLNANLAVVEKGKNTGILSFSFESPNRTAAAQTLNEVANIYVRQNVEQKSKEAQNTLEFLNKQLPAIKEQLEAATDALNNYRTNKGSIDLDIETQSVLGGVVEIQTQITLLQQKRDELRGKFTESHPTVVAIDKQIARLQAQMSANDIKIEALPETQQVILRLSRDVKVNTELYTTLLNNAQTLKVTNAGTVGNARIIDEAVPPVTPIKPKKLLIVAASFILGLIVGVGWVFFRKTLNRGVENPVQIEKQLNIPIYATIPHSHQQVKLNEKLKKLNKQKSDQIVLLALENKEDLAIEGLRSLRTTLHFTFFEAQNNIIMISGPSPGIGKTFVSTNLAIVLADTGKKILLIDADLRKGVINNCLGTNREDGLSDLISGTTTLDKAVRHLAAANIDFIPTGSIPTNPSELLMHERFGQLLETLSKQYNHIIIDSPPILAVTDACIIGRMASTALMIIKAGQHSMLEIEQSAKTLTQAGVNLKGIVFNDLPISSSGYGYGKYVYGYSYQKTSHTVSDK